MKVKDLLIELQDYPADAEIKINDQELSYVELDGFGQVNFVEENEDGN